MAKPVTRKKKMQATALRRGLHTLLLLRRALQVMLAKRSTAFVKF